MPRINRRPLRGSVTQNTRGGPDGGMTLRIRAQPTTPRGFLLRLGILIGGVLTVLIVFLWSWHDGWPGRALNRSGNILLTLSQEMHFAVRNIVVIGCEQTSKDDLTAALGTKIGAAIFAFDPDVAQARVAKLPWVADTTIERRLPDVIMVRMTERTPMARWQHNNKTVIIDTDGKVLDGADTEKFSTLPLVVGSNADDEAHNLLTTLQDYPTVRKYMTAASRVGGRRWDFYLQPSMVAKMPEGDMSAALQQLTTLINEKKILERDMVSVDLRLPDRTILEPGDNAQPRPAGATHP